MGKVEWWALVGVVGANRVVGWLGPVGSGFGRYIQSKKYLSKWPIICQMSNGQTAGLWRRCIKKNLT